MKANLLDDLAKGLKKNSKAEIAWHPTYGHVIIWNPDESAVKRTPPDILRAFFDVDTPEKLFKFFDAFGNLFIPSQTIRSSELEPCKYDALREEAAPFLGVTKRGLTELLKNREIKTPQEECYDLDIPKDPFGSSIVSRDFFLPLRDVFAMLSIFNLVIKVKRLLDEDALAIESLEKLGFVISYGELEEISKLAYSIPLDSPSLYAEFLLERSRSVEHVTPCDNTIEWEFDIKKAKLSPLKRKKCLQVITTSFIDDMVTLHLSDVRAISIGIGLAVECDTPISSIWYRLMEAFGTGRAMVCEECGKPFVTKRERGKQRKFCSEKCNKRNQRKPKNADSNVN